MVIGSQHPIESLSTNLIKFYADIYGSSFFDRDAFEQSDLVFVSFNTEAFRFFAIWILKKYLNSVDVTFKNWDGW